MAADPGTTGATVTDEQIIQVRDYEQAIVDGAPGDPQAAEGAITICTKALAGNPKDRNKAALLYNALVVADAIP